MTDLEELERVAEQTAFGVRGTLLGTRRGKAWSSHCGAGHEFTAENTRTYKQNGRLRRVCKECDKGRKKRPLYNARSYPL